MEVKALIDFLDIRTNDMRKAGDIFACSFDRYNEMLCNGIKVEPVRINYRGKKKKTGPKVIIYQKLLYVIGGIETWDNNLARTFEDRDITFVFSSADKTQMVELSKYANVIIDNGDSNYECDVLINANYDGSDILLPRTKAKKVYQAIHSDFKALKEVNGWTNFNLSINPRTDAIFSASETAQKGLKSGFGYDSVVAPNILAKADTKRPMVFISLTRASEEKGIRRVIQMAREFKRKGHKFIWLLATTLNAADSEANARYIEAIKGIPEFIVVQPQLYTRELLCFADYLVQCSDTEAYCYSIREALQRKVSVIATKFTEATKIIEDGKNGYLLDFDLSNLNVEKIFKNIPKINKAYTEPISPIWETILKGEL